MVAGERCAVVEAESGDGGCVAGGWCGHVGAVGLEVVGDVQVEEGWVGDGAEELGMWAVGGQFFVEVGPIGIAAVDACWWIGRVGGLGLNVDMGACRVSSGALLGVGFSYGA